MISGGKSKYTCLLTLIKRESPKLYELICDLCLDGTFRSQRYQNTFLMPNEALVKHIERLVEKDEDVKAIDIIRSLMLKGHLKEGDFKKGANIGTLQFGSFVLAKPEDISVKESKKSLITTREGAYATVVYNYTSDSAPATVEGKSGGMIPVGMIAGGAVNEDIEVIKRITISMIMHGDCRATVNNFFKGVVGGLVILQNKDEALFKRAKYYLAANPILAWFFLTMPGRGDALLTASDLKDFQWRSASDMSIIKQAEEVDYKLDKNLLKKIKTQRSQLINEKGDRASLTRMVKSVYKDMISEVAKCGALDDALAKHVDLKILMDELRFIHDDSVKSWDQVDDALSDLGAINWSKPADSIVICDSDTYEKHLIKGVEAFVSGPVMFVKSIYFMYVPLTDTVEEQLIKAMDGGVGGGSIHGGNPAAINNVIFSGGAARKQLKANSDMKLSSLVKVLSKTQREALKAML